MNLMNVNLNKVGAYTLLGVGVLTLLSGIGTFFGTLDPLLVEWGMADLAIVFGILKLIGAGLLIWGKTRIVGALFAASYYGGALSAHVSFQSFNVQFVAVIVILIAVWVGTLAKVTSDRYQS